LARREGAGLKSGVSPEHPRHMAFFGKMKYLNANIRRSKRRNGK
jgi:hypothetical protein